MVFRAPILALALVAIGSSCRSAEESVLAPLPDDFQSGWFFLLPPPADRDAALNVYAAPLLDSALVDGLARARDREIAATVNQRLERVRTQVCSGDRAKRRGLIDALQSLRRRQAIVWERMQTHYHAVLGAAVEDLATRRTYPPSRLERIRQRMQAVRDLEQERMHGWQELWSTELERLSDADSPGCASAAAALPPAFSGPLFLARLRFFDAIDAQDRAALVVQLHGPN